MNRESDEQRAVSQTLCGALQKEANCKCLVLSVLIYGCLAAVTWCRCANVTKVVINFDNYPLKRTEHVSPCDEGYIYIPVAFMGMLYLVYLVECYHSPIRIDLVHAEGQDNVATKLSQLKLAQPTIWWKAVSYHYVRRKRQITRYRNGDNYTTTQVYYERANTHAATSFYFYDYCGVKDISKDLTMEPKIPITKITLTKGFAFSNMRSATEFEEARSRFFAEQELRDDYMEMREGLDLGYNFSPTTVVGILGKPWFTNSYVYWCLSALLLSWPLRIIIEYNTQYADYQVTKLFGVNYDTPTSGEPIHASPSQLSAPGSYMLAPSYSEALLMDPSPGPTGSRTHDDAVSSNDPARGDMVPSYSEALLYERAHQMSSTGVDLETSDLDLDLNCDCFRRVPTREHSDLEVSTSGPLNGPPETPISGPKSQPEVSVKSSPTSPSSFCQRCRDAYTNVTKWPMDFRRNSLETCRLVRDRTGSHLTRDLSAPNFSTQTDFASSATFPRHNGNSLENILENDELPEVAMADATGSGRAFASTTATTGSGAIPKKRVATSTSGEFFSTSNATGSGRGLVENSPITAGRRATRSTGTNVIASNTYFCLKSILKQHKRRYTLVTAEELNKMADDEIADETRIASGNPTIPPENKRTLPIFDRDDSFRGRKDAASTSGRPTGLLADERLRRVASSRSLIFASPIEEACRSVASDPFGGKAVHVLPARTSKPPDWEGATDQPRFSKLARSLTSVPRKSIPAEPLRRVRSGRGRGATRNPRPNHGIEPDRSRRGDDWSASSESEKASTTASTMRASDAGNSNASRSAALIGRGATGNPGRGDDSRASSESEKSSTAASTMRASDAGNSNASRSAALIGRGATGNPGRGDDSRASSESEKSSTTASTMRASDAGNSNASRSAAMIGRGAPTAATNRRTRVRGASLNDATNPRAVTRILRGIANDTSGDASTLLHDDETEVNDDTMAKPFNLTMETSL